MGTHLRVLSESYQMNTNMTGFRWVSKILCVLVLWSEVASALGGLSGIEYFQSYLAHVSIQLA